jgi:hypothetical protein
MIESYEALKKFYSLQQEIYEEIEEKIVYYHVPEWFSLDIIFTANDMIHLLCLLKRNWEANVDFNRLIGWFLKWKYLFPNTETQFQLL